MLFYISFGFDYERDFMIVDCEEKEVGDIAFDFAREYLESNYSFFDFCEDRGFNLNSPISEEAYDDYIFNVIFYDWEPYDEENDEHAAVFGEKGIWRSRV